MMNITIYGVNNKVNDEQPGIYDESRLVNGAVRLSDNFSSADPLHKLILKPKAVFEIFNFIEWDVGQRADTRNEQGGILIGKRYFDEMKRIHYVVVSKAIIADEAEGSTGYLNITHDCWNNIHEKKDNYNRETGEDAVIVGWFHTHPNMLPCFMSGTDRNTQDLFFDGDNTYSIVINPQRHLLKAFRSKECFAAQAILLLDEAYGTEEQIWV